MHYNHDINRQKIRVLHISSESSWRGGEQQIAYLINEAAKYKVESHVLCRKGSAFEKFCIKNNINYISKSFSGIQILKTAYFLKEHARDFDIVHAHTAKAHMLTYFSLKLGLKTPVFIARRVDFVPSNSYLTKSRYEHKGISKIICVSHAICDIMKTYLDKNRNKCVTIHSGIDLSKFDKKIGTSIKELYQIGEDKKLIGNTSALADHKDYYTFLDTAKNLLDQGLNVHFIIMGSGPLEQEIKSYSDKLGLKDNITFTGFIDNIPQVLPQLDVFLITSKTEGLGTSILDAFACSVPVVATRAGGIPELIEHEITGLAADVKDVNQLTIEVSRLLENNHLRLQIVKKAKDKLTLFTKDYTAKKTVKLYQEELR